MACLSSVTYIAQYPSLVKNPYRIAAAAAAQYSWLLQRGVFVAAAVVYLLLQLLYLMVQVWRIWCCRGAVFAAAAAAYLLLQLCCICCCKCGVFAAAAAVYLLVQLRCICCCRCGVFAAAAFTAAAAVHSIVCSCGVFAAAG